MSGDKIIQTPIIEPGINVIRRMRLKKWIYDDYPLFERWLYIHKVCYNENHRCFKKNGGNNIKVCDKWRLNSNYRIDDDINIRIYKKFEKDMEKINKDILKNYSDLIISRKNPLKDYSPDNITITLNKSKNTRHYILKNKVVLINDRYFFTNDIKDILEKNNIKITFLNRVLFNEKYKGDFDKFLTSYKNYPRFKRKKNILDKGFANLFKTLSNDKNILSYDKDCVIVKDNKILCEK